MSRASLLALCTATLCFLSACPATVPKSVHPAAPRVHVPPGCEQNLSGSYYHSESSAYRYRGEDDGGTLTLTVLQQGVTAEPADGGAASTSIVLWRRPDGFSGETRAVGFTVSGTPCPVSFPTELTACSDAGLMLRTASTITIDEECHGPPGEAPAAHSEQRLVRGVPPAPDAG